MSRLGRFDVVRTGPERDGLGRPTQSWHARFTSTRIIAWTETYARKVGAQRAVRSIVRGVLAVAADWLDEYADDVFHREDSPWHLNERLAYHSAADLLRQAATANNVADALTDSERAKP